MDNFRRKLFLKYELKVLLLRYVMRNESISYAVRLFASYQKSEIIRFSSITEQRNRCVQTGRVFNVIKRTQYSRFVFRREASIGNMPGCRIATW